MLLAHCSPQRAQLRCCRDRLRAAAEPTFKLLCPLRDAGNAVHPLQGLRSQQLGRAGQLALLAARPTLRVESGETRVTLPPGSSWHSSRAQQVPATPPPTTTWRTIPRRSLPRPHRLPTRPCGQAVALQDAPCSRLVLQADCKGPTRAPARQSTQRPWPSPEREHPAGHGRCCDGAGCERQGGQLPQLGRPQRQGQAPGEASGGPRPSSGPGNNEVRGSGRLCAGSCDAGGPTTTSCQQERSTPQVSTTLACCGRPVPCCSTGACAGLRADGQPAQRRYCEHIYKSTRRPTRTINIGGVKVGSEHPIALQARLAAVYSPGAALCARAEPGAEPGRVCRR